jgi:hypothetical protein
MKLIVAVLVLLACSLVQASDGAGYVPAHRTKDGHYVPPNVPSSSVGTVSSRRLKRPGGHHARSARLLPPILVEARGVHP